jgi:hypothetical protein
MNLSILKWFEKILEERFGHLFQLAFESGNVVISLEKYQGNISIVHSVEYYTIPNKIQDCFNWVYKEKVIPAASNNELPTSLVSSRKGITHIDFDILGLIYWLLNRIEEIGANNKDGHDRFQAINSHAYKHGYLERPIADEWLNILGEKILEKWPELELRKHQFRVNLSHDVDQPTRYAFRGLKAFVREVGVEVLRHKRFKNLVLGPIIYFGTKSKLLRSDPANTFDWIMDISEKYNIRSAFYFICGKSHPVNDADYSIEHPVIRKLIREIHARGHEIGLHPSYNCYQNEKRFLEEAVNLKNVCTEEKVPSIPFGGRMHFLRWEHPQTLTYCNNAGMSYDSTLGFSDLPGFRCGTCFEYPAFDPVKMENLSIRIRPLIVMDCTVTADRYMKLGLDQAAQKIIELKDRCREVGGQFTILWHNTELADEKSRELYESVLSN